MDPTRAASVHGCHPESVSTPATSSAASQPNQPRQSRHRERLTPPWWGWLLAALWASTLGIAYGSAISLVVGLVVGGSLFAIAGWALVAMSAPVEVVAGTVGEGVLRAGRAELPASAIGDVTVLDADAARLVRGTEADPRAFVVLRGWVREAVKVQVVDAADPTPYWYVSTRRPQALAAALRALT